MSLIYVVWVLVALAIGYLWKKWGLSFSSGIIWSLVLSPVGGLILGFIWKSAKNKNGRT